MTIKDEQDHTQSSAYNPFPEPQTIPSGWDMSGFLSENESDVTNSDEDGSAES